MFVIYEACTVDYNLEKGDNPSIIKRVKSRVCVYMGSSKESEYKVPMFFLFLNMQCFLFFSICD